MPLPVYFPVDEGDIKRGTSSPLLGGHTFPCSATNPTFGIVPKDTIKQAFEKLSGGTTDYMGWFIQDTAPTAAQVPNSKWGFWFRPVNGRLRMVARYGGNLYAVQLT